MASHWSRACTLAHNSQVYWPAQRWELAISKLLSMRMLHHALGRLSDVHLVSGLRKPGNVLHYQQVHHLRSVSKGRNIYYANVPIHCCYPLVRSGLEKFTRYDFFYSKDNAVSTSYSYCCAAVFNCFYCVFDLGFSCSATAMIGSRFG